jgi:hypothetical protein
MVPKPAIESPPPLPLPLVVQVGFAGTRHLLPIESSKALQTELEAKVMRKLKDVLESLKPTGTEGRALGLREGHFLCGVSQIAIGGDTLFTQACAATQIGQRIFLTNTPNEYFSASGDSGPDFSGEQRHTAEQFLASDRIFQVRVISTAPCRSTRFVEANLEIARVSDICLCVLRDDRDRQRVSELSDDSPPPNSPSEKIGGTLEFVSAAKRRGRPIWLIYVSVNGDKIELREDHLNWPGKRDGPKSWPIPAMPEVFNTGKDWTSNLREARAVPITPREYVNNLKTWGSGVAKRQKWLFRNAALIIIGAHLLATILAVAALSFPQIPKPGLFLGFELALLLIGLAVHFALHHSEASRRWALSRLGRELSRSGEGVAGCHVHLEYLFSLPFPQAFKPILRTINVLHLASSRVNAGIGPSAGFVERRDSYVRERVQPQIDYYSKALNERGKLLHLSISTFYACAVAAVVGSVFKLFWLLVEAPHEQGTHPAWMGGLEILGIVLPIAAVGALSLAASFDLEAEVQTYADTLKALDPTIPRNDSSPIRPGDLKQVGMKQLLEGARTEVEFHRLMIETETLLLSEIANWYARRSVKGVS